jgi:hypothetical protein
MNSFMSGVLCVTLAAAIGCALAYGEGRNDRIVDGLRKSASYRVRYLNPEVSPRTIYAVADINADGADFDVTVKCFVDTCERASKFLNQLRSARRADRRCIGPSYMRIDFKSFDRTRNTLSFAFDHSGTCFVFDGVSYALREDLIWRLHNEPVKDW